MKPGIKNKVDTKEGWTIENEIAWLENYIEFNKRCLDEFYAQREWWVRFIDYCNGNYHD